MNCEAHGVRPSVALRLAVVERNPALTGRLQGGTFRERTAGCLSPSPSKRLLPVGFLPPASLEPGDDGFEPAGCLLPSLITQAWHVGGSRLLDRIENRQGRSRSSRAHNRTASLVMLSALPLQRMACDVAVRHGGDVDQRRNLAKSMTVVLQCDSVV